jgi:4-azaleucine resistance transporter AzlC
MSGTRTAFSIGVTAMAPLLLGIIPFGLIFGVAAVESGIGGGAGIGLSVFVFAGAAQLATVELIGSDTAPAVIVATALVINARHLMYSASLAPRFRGLSRWGRIGVAYLLTDQGYAVSITEYRRRHLDLRDRVAFYVGAALALWLTWQICTAVGIVVGAGVPDSWSLDFAVPLVFLALLVPAVTDRSSAAAAAAAGTVAALAAGLPLNLGVMVGAAAGIVAGVITERSLPPR